MVVIFWLPEGLTHWLPVARSSRSPASRPKPQATIRELRASICARYQAWDELVTLHREAQIQRALAAEREPDAPLH
jgi:hypothetical protein